MVYLVPLGETDSAILDKYNLASQCIMTSRFMSWGTTAGRSVGDPPIGEYGVFAVAEPLPSHSVFETGVAQYKVATFQDPTLYLDGFLESIE